MKRELTRLCNAWSLASEPRRAGFLGCLCALLFTLVNWSNTCADSLGQCLTPVVLLREGTVRLDRYRDYYEDMRRVNLHYSFTEADGHLYPRNSVFVALLVTPLYLPPVLLGVPTLSVKFWFGWSGVAAAVWTGVAVGLMYRTARRWGSEATAVGLTLLLAFGTGLWTTNAHIVYDHMGGVLCVAALAYVLHDFPLTPGRAFGAAFLAGAAVGMRPTVVLLLLPLGLYLFCWPGLLAGWRGRLAALAGVLVVPLVNAGYNALCFGHWSKTGYPAGMVTQWDNPWWEGLPGLLVAPNSGLLTQSPFLALAAFGVWAAWRNSAVAYPGLLRAYSLCFLGYWVLFAHRFEWHGGVYFSTRFLSEAYPLLLPLAVAGWSRVRSHPAALPLVVAAGAWAVLYQVVNIATFDAVTRDDAPPNLPWQPARHYVMLYVARFGWASAFGAAAGVLAKFFLCAAALVYVLSRPFFPWAADHRPAAAEPGVLG